MGLSAVCVLVTCVALLGVPSGGVPTPDSRGIRPLEPGFAYGGIPYGSVSGMLNSYFGGPYQLPGISSRRSFGSDLQNL